MGNAPLSTAGPVRPQPPSTPTVDKKRGLTCGNGVIHGFHRPYYYHYTYRPIASFKSGWGRNLWTTVTRHPFGLLPPVCPVCRWSTSDCPRRLEAERQSSTDSRSDDQDQKNQTCERERSIQEAVTGEVPGGA
ncbi:hypothetical protein GCM10010505_22080 [Kitasatospora aburaviensis]